MIQVIIANESEHKFEISLTNLIIENECIGCLLNILMADLINISPRTLVFPELFTICCRIISDCIPLGYNYSLNCWMSLFPCQPWPIVFSWIPVGDIFANLWGEALRHWSSKARISKHTDSYSNYSRWRLVLRVSPQSLWITLSPTRGSIYLWEDCKGNDNLWPIFHSDLLKTQIYLGNNDPK